MDGTGSGYCLSLALTRVFARHFVFFKLRQGAGTYSHLLLFGFKIVICLRLMSCVYSKTKKVSYLF